MKSYEYMLWRKRSEESVKIGYRRLLKRIFTLPSGVDAEFTIKQERPTVCVLALTTTNEVILAQQFRPGPERILLELPGGGIEKDETPIDAAKRELLEETGYAGDMQFVTDCIDCGYSTLSRSCFIATNCRKIAEPTPDENEFIETVLMPLPDFREHLRSGNLSDVEVGYLGLDFLKLL
jgi:ADP-ribose pyrophosphatase